MKVDNLMINLRKVNLNIYLIILINFKDKLVEIIEKIPGILFN